MITYALEYYCIHQKPTMPTENKPVENALATIGAVFWTIQILPQIYKSWRSKSTLGLSFGLMSFVPSHFLISCSNSPLRRNSIWASACLPFSSYIVVQRLSIPLQLQPQAFGALAGFSCAQILYYGHGYSKLKAGLCYLAFLCVWAGFESGSVYALWVSLGLRFAVVEMFCLFC